MTPTPLSPALARFLESGLSITVATRDGDLVPDGAVGWAARVHEDAAGLTLFLFEDAGRAMLKNLEHHPEIAILFDQPSRSRACQVKGTFTGSRRAKPDERTIVDAQVEGFARELEAIGIPRAMTADLRTWPCLAFDVRVENVFEQTPGPGAGEPLK
jgi:hypothetical protein